MPRLLIACSILACAAVAVTGCERENPGPAPSKPTNSPAAPVTQPVATAPAGAGPAAAAPQTGRQQFDEFSFELPPGWLRVDPDRAKTKAMILLGAPRWDQAKGLIKVDVAGPAFPTPQAMAQGLAGGVDGRVDPATLELDGQPCVRVTAGSTDLTKPRGVLIAYRNNQAYMLGAAGPEQTDVLAALEHVRATWKWTR
ncbi:MAG TPA: hypothetical protein VER17_11310 [Tepidisphaeraceae bacterium]|nr:hypothetical protein [Tepidisphaeraceae bacterium]